jgi:serine/threonine-protein kinase
MAWEGTDPASGLPVRVEAAARGSRPVFFRVTGPWSAPSLEGSRSEQGGSPPGSSRGGAARRLQTQIVTAPQVIGGLVFVAALVAGGILARRNLRSGRGDPAGALKVALVYLAGSTLVWIVRADHVPRLLVELGQFRESTAATLFSAALLWLLYVALEPFARRRWPRTLISWNRLLAGRFRDPLVGRDILIGCLLGSTLWLLMILEELTPGWLGWPPPPPSAGGLDHLGELRWHLAQVMDSALGAVDGSMHALFVLVLLRFVLRKDWPTGAAFVVIYTVRVGLRADYLPLAVLFNGAMVALWVTSVLRLGFLAAACGVFVVFLLGSVGLTTNLTAWYGTGSATALVALSAFALYGFHTALAGRPMFGQARSDH